MGEVYRADGRGNFDIWVYDVTRGVRTRITFDPATDGFAIWSPDGRRIVFASNRRGNGDLYQKASSGAGNDDLLIGGDQGELPTSCSHAAGLKR